jgi:hypothetical protein
MKNYSLNSSIQKLPYDNSIIGGSYRKEKIDFGNFNSSKNVDL